MLYISSGCPQQPGKPQWDVSGKFAVVRWKKAAVLAGDPPVTLYIVQAKERSTSMSYSHSVYLDLLSIILMINLLIVR